jgi:hypothetical protein
MDTLRRVASAAGLLFEIPAACLSFGFYKTTQSLMRQLVRLHLSRNEALALRWRVLSGPTLKMPFSLPVVMTSGPRWNPHAIIANVGPLCVTRSLAVHTAAVENSAASWAVVVHSYPNLHTAVCLASLSRPFGYEWEEVHCEPGAYSLILRYYHWRDAVELPALMVDGRPAVDSMRVSPDVNDFYRDLPMRRSPFYLLLHYYVLTVLQFRRWLPESFVRREFLPVGNPETGFYFDLVRPGNRLHFEIEPSLLRSYEIFYTLYTRDSFPVEWEQITEPDHRTCVTRASGFYLVRVIKRGSGEEDPERVRLGITIERETL